jgi:hypothetical protein
MHFMIVERATHLAGCANSGGPAPPWAGSFTQGNARPTIQLRTVAIVSLVAAHQDRLGAGTLASHAADAAPLR